MATPAQLKRDFPSADILPGNRVVFNIKENHYRLIAKIHYNTGITAYIKSKSKVSEVLNRKRPLSLSMIRSLHQGLGIPAEILVREPDPDYKT